MLKRYKNLQRVLAFLLIFVMIFGTTPVMAFESEQPEETTGVTESGIDEQGYPDEVDVEDPTDIEGDSIVDEPAEPEELEEGLEEEPKEELEAVLEEKLEENLIAPFLFDGPTRSSIITRLGYNRGLVEDNKYIALFLDGALAYLGHAIHGGPFEQPKAFMPSEQDVIIEFNQEQTQQISIQILDSNKTILGTIVTDTFEGQWGVYQGEQYDPHVDICNQVVWDGLFIFEPEDGLDENAFPPDIVEALRGNEVYPGEYQPVYDMPGSPDAQILGWELVRKEYNYYIRFQPTHENNQQYYLDMPILIKYSDDAFLGYAQFIPNMYYNNPFIYDCFGLEPVNMINGNFMWSYTDLSVYGAMPLEITRYYNALDKNISEMGTGWRHNYLVELDKQVLYTTVTMPDGYIITFNNFSDGTYTSPNNVDMTLEAAGSGFIMTYRDKTEYHFNSDGFLIAIVNVSGERTEISRNGSQINTISNRTGTLTFAYSSGKITSITDQTGRKVTYSYSGDNLTTFKNADEDTIGYTYSNGLLTKISDFNGNTYLENTYDSLGRIIEQYVADQGTSYIEYNTVDRVNSYTDPDGSTTKYYYDRDQNLLKKEDEAGAISYTYENGRLVSRSDRLGNTTTYTYDSEGNHTSITYPDGTTEYFEYNSLNLVTKATAKDGTVTHYEYDGQGNTISYTDARGNTSTYTYDSNNNMLTSTDALGNTTHFTYDAKGNCLTQADPLGNVTSFEYDSLGRLVLQTNADGGTVVYEYSTAGKLVKITDPDGNEQTYTVSGNGYDTGNTDPIGFSTSTVYNEQNRPIAVTDAEGNMTTYAYDEVGQMISTTDALGGVTRYAYDLAGRMTGMTDARGNTWTYSYDAEGRMTVSADPLGNSTSRAYDNMGRTVSSTNARYAVTKYEYDSMGRTVKTTDALGNYSRNVYDNNGNLVEQYDKNGNKWSFIYDANNRMVEAKDPLGYVTTYTYDANGQQTKTVSALGAQNQSVFDSMGRLISSTDPEGNVTTNEYDILGRLVKVNYADGTFITYSYNNNGWLVAATAQDGGVISYTYNNNGQVLTITDALGGVTSYVYDALGRTTSTTNALDGVTSYVYDVNGNLLSSTDPLGGVTSYVYDALNRVIATTDALGNVSRVEYDANGNASKVTNADGGVIVYSYDLLDRLTSYTDAEGYTFSFNYDANGNKIGTIDGRGNSTSAEYDGLNRSVKQYDQIGNFTSVVYDADGRMIKSVNAEGAETNYIYDLNGNVVKVTDALGNATTITYDNMNRVATTTDALGAVTSYSYTATGRVETITDALGGVKSYEYDLLGNLLKETNELGNSTTYTYDALSRPLTVTNPLGNKDTLTYDANNRITSVTDKNGNVTNYRYDANGNVVETIDALNHSSYFEYDSMNRLIKVTIYRIDNRHKVNEAQVTLYSYDKRGLIINEINAANNQIIYVYDGNGNLVQKTDADGYVTDFGFDPRNLVDAINYANGKEVQFAYNKNGELIAMMDWNGTVNFALDILDRIISVNDQNEKVTSYTYDAVGNQTSIKYPDGTVAAYTYDLLHRLTNLKDAENQNTSYQYDAASQLIAMAYPNKWDESYTYDAAGQKLTQLAKDPSDKVNKQILHTFEYDPQGNITREFRSGAGGQDKYDYTHTYDALNRLTRTTGLWGYKEHTYEYDSLGNLLYEKNANGTKKGNEYWYNNLNQQVRRLTDDKDNYTYTFDKRGNLVEGVYHGNGANANRVEERYVYDATNRMVKGTKYLGTSVTYEDSYYIYNGLGYLVSNEWVTAKNAYGYHGVGVNLDPSEQVGGVVVCDRHKNTTGQGHINPTGKGHTTGGTTGGIAPTIDKGKFAIVHKDYVLDYTSPLQNVIMEYESGDNGLTYRYTFGLQKDNVVIYGIPNGAGSVMQYVYSDELGDFVLTAEDPGHDVVKNNIVKLYYHHDHLGSTDYLTDNIAGKVTSYVTYDDWGELTAKAILKMGVRELDLVTEYTGHPFDPVLNLYYAKARMYDAQDRRFVAVDPLKGYIDIPQSLIQYTYCLNNPLKYTDPTGCDGGPWRENMGLVGPYDTAQNDITQIIQNAAKHVTDPVRRHDLLLGFIASMAKGMLDFGATPAAVWDVINATTSGNTNALGFPDIIVSWNTFNQYTNNTDQLVSKLSVNATYPDSFYLGKMIGDATLMGFGAAVTVEGVITAVGGIATGTAAIGGSGGLALAPAIALAGEAIGVGSLTASAGLTLVQASWKSYGGDKANYNYYAKLECESILQFLKDIKVINGKYYAPKNVIDEIGRIESAKVDFSILDKKIVSSRASTEGGYSQIVHYSDSAGTRFIVHEVTDARGNVLHRDFDAVRIQSGQIINKL